MRCSAGKAPSAADKFMPQTIRGVAPVLAVISRSGRRAVAGLPPPAAGGGSRKFSEMGDVRPPTPPKYTGVQGPPAVAKQPADAPADPWSAVVCPKTGGTYYWNTLTNETTMVGEPKPQTMYRQPVQPEAHGSMGGMIVSNVVLGAGVALGFGLVSAVLC